MSRKEKGTQDTMLANSLTGTLSRTESDDEMQFLMKYISKKIKNLRTP